MKQYLSLFVLVTLLAGGFYLVPDQAKAIEGLDIQSGEVSVRHQWTNVTFDTAFTNQPVVFAQIQTENNGQAAYVDLRNTSTTGFQVKVEEDRGRIRTWLNGAHPFETVKWFAFDPTEIVAGYGVESAL
ncbi:MAG: H-type lectin domain-containing protein, partial [Candidatus Uhrbacteria bacterium]